jgi:hypothetical protein
MKVTPAHDGVHKWTATFKDGKSTSFGSKGMDNYTLTRDKARVLRPSERGRCSSHLRLRERAND